MKVKKRTLLLIACLVWSAAGANILRIGIISYLPFVSLFHLLLSAAVFLLFDRMIFGRLVEIHTLRILLCLFPQNAWTSADAPLSWGILRNIPFALLGLLIIVLFYQSAKKHNDRSFGWMWLTIVLSFGFYIPVVLWADTIPMIGMLMIPKTCAYVWTVLIGFLDMRRAAKA